MENPTEEIITRVVLIEKAPTPFWVDAFSNEEYNGTFFDTLLVRACVSIVELKGKHIGECNFWDFYIIVKGAYEDLALPKKYCKRIIK